MDGALYVVGAEDFFHTIVSIIVTPDPKCTEPLARLTNPGTWPHRMSNPGHRSQPLKSKSAFPALLIVPLFSACSWLIVEAPPVGYERFNYVPCTQSKVVPTIDAGVAAVSTWLSLMAMTSDEFVNGLESGGTWLNVPGASYSKTGGIVTFLSVGVLTGVSAGMGFKKVRECRAAVLEVAARNRQITAQNGDGSPRLHEYAWFAPLFPAPIFGADPPDLPVAIPSLRWFDQLFPAPDFGANAFDPVFRGAISNSPDQ